MLVGKNRGMRPIVNLRCRFEDNIKMDRKEISWGNVDVINLSEDREDNGFFHGCSFCTT